VIKLTWKLNGQTIAPGQLGNEVMKSMRAEVHSRTKRAIAGVRCPVHGSTPTNIRMGNSGAGGVRFEYECCCDALQQAVNASFQ